MQLYSSPPSPFGRKVKVAAHILGLNDQIEIVQTDTFAANDPIRQINPLGKIPALVTGDATFYDSRVIMEYLDNLAGGDKIMPLAADARFACMVRMAMIDGMLDAALAIVYEARLRPEDMRSDSVVAHQRDKIIRVLQSLESGAAAQGGYTNGTMPDAAEIGLACALEYMDFRNVIAWEQYAPSLRAWLADINAKVTALVATHPAT